jgi:RNA polymerase-interacting CarD/CdnL/TRCF family regulator
LGKGLVVWVPIDGTSELSLRPPLTPEVIQGLAEILRGPAHPMETVSRAREQQVKALLKDGSPAVLCALVRDLTVYTATHPASANDTAVLDKTRSMLAAEWQLATGAPDAAAQIDGLLRESVQLSVQTGKDGA